jgi:hypothetical protein
MFKIGDLVKFNLVEDDSCQASECFGFDPSCGNDWFDIQAYVETAHGEIVKPNTIEIIYKSGKRSGKFFKISKSVIKGELDKLLSLKEKYNIKLSQVFDGSGLSTIKQFQEITKIKFIQLDKTTYYTKISDKLPPQTGLYDVWEQCKIGMSYRGRHNFNGKWETSTLNENWFYKVERDRVYMNGKVFVQEFDKNNNIPKCVQCGCVGNNSCGNNSVKNCALNQSLICPCCENKQ